MAAINIPTQKDAKNMMANILQKNTAITLTLGDVAENNPEIQKTGTVATSEFTINDLQDH
jgi:hypothetical protein